MKKKILSLENLKKIVNKKRKKKIVLCHGVFDLLHYGHLEHFKEAKQNGDILIVTITPDKFVNKGPGRPAFNENLRALSLSELKSIDYVAINSSHSATNVIKKLRPNYYCKGPDYKDLNNDVTQEITKEISAVKKIGGKIIFTKGKTFSSSNLINQFLINKQDSKSLLLGKIKKELNFNKIKKIFDKIKKIKILIIGELIIDKYVFCEALGKSGKEPVLVLKDKFSEEYLGGSGAIARHVSEFSNNITLFSMIGEKGEFKNKIKSILPKNVQLKLLNKNNSPTILKTRFVDSVNLNKVLGVYNINDDLLDRKQEKKQFNFLNKNLPKYDLVIVSDYGHGFITKSLAKLICRKSKFLALNAQVNAANIGYHSMRNYKNISCVIINQKELEMEFREKSKNLNDLVKKLALKNNISNLIVTQGSKGAVLYDKKKNKFYKSPAFATQVTDKIGAGDAFLSLSSILLKAKEKKELALLMGSLAAAQSTESLGNKSSISKIKILKSLEHLLK